MQGERADGDGRQLASLGPDPVQALERERERQGGNDETNRHPGAHGGIGRTREAPELRGARPAGARRSRRPRRSIPTSVSNAAACRRRRHQRAPVRPPPSGSAAATSTSRMSRGHGPRASNSGPLRRLPPASSRAHAALPRPSRAISRPISRSPARGTSTLKRCPRMSSGSLAVTSRAQFSAMASGEAAMVGRRQFLTKRSLRLRSRERLVRVELGLRTEHSPE